MSVSGTLNASLYQGYTTLWRGTQPAVTKNTMLKYTTAMPTGHDRIGIIFGPNASFNLLILNARPSSDVTSANDGGQYFQYAIIDPTDTPFGNSDYQTKSQITLRFGWVYLGTSALRIVGNLYKTTSQITSSTASIDASDDLIREVFSFKSN